MVRALILGWVHGSGIGPANAEEIRQSERAAVDLRHLYPPHESVASTPRAGIARSERNPPSRVAKPLGATLVRCHIAWRSSRRRGGAVAASIISVLGRQHLC